MKINNNSIPLLYSHTGCSLVSGQCDYKDNEMGFVDIVLIILLVSFVLFSPFIINEVKNKTNETNEWHVVEYCEGPRILTNKALNVSRTDLGVLFVKILKIPISS